MLTRRRPTRVIIDPADNLADVVLQQRSSRVSPLAVESSRNSGRPNPVSQASLVSQDRRRLRVGQASVTLHRVSAGHRGRGLRPVTALVMQAHSSFWHLLMFDRIDDVDIEAATAVFGTVDILARAAAGAVRPGCGPFPHRVHDFFPCRLTHLPPGGQNTVILLRSGA
jgi:hypothetical protein